MPGSVLLGGFGEALGNGIGNPCGNVGARARQRTDPLSKSELIDITDLWVELALELGDNELRRMECLGRHQQRRRVAA